MADNPKRVVWAPQAKYDLREIWRYFARVGSAEVADRLLREIDRAGKRLGQHALMGRPRDELSPSLRSVLVHPHVIFYRVSEEGIEIARVLHQRRDLAAILAKEQGQ